MSDERDRHYGEIIVHCDNSPYDYLMGACDNASRVVSYVVIMGQGYASNPLLGMRIHDINVEAEIIRSIPQIPDPVAADGTPEGTSEIAAPELGPSIAGIFENAVSAISALWTLDNWWPLLHFLVDLVVTDDVSISIHATLDLLGNVNMEEFNPSLFGIGAMTSQQADQITNSIDAETTWSRAVQSMLGATALLFFALQIISFYLTPATENIFWFTLGVALTTFLLTMMLLIWQIRAFNLDPVTKGIYFFYTALLAIGGAFLNYAKVCDMTKSTGGSAIFKYFDKTYYDGNAVTQAKGVKGRSHTALMFSQIACFLIVIIVAGGFVLNLW